MRSRLTAETGHKPDWSAADGLLFDLDGVLTPTALIHAEAWHETFRQILKDQLRGGLPSKDYLSFFDGRPRREALAGYLAYRGVLPQLTASWTSRHLALVDNLAAEKDIAFREVLEREGIQAYAGSLKFLSRLPSTTRLAVVSSSRNAHAVLQSAGIADLFDVVVDGAAVADRGLQGKPAPDPFLLGSELLGVAPAHAACIEDSLSGTRAASAAGFGLVIGVNRGAGRAPLVAAGAQVVVEDLAELL